MIFKEAGTKFYAILQLKSIRKGTVYYGGTIMISG